MNHKMNHKINHEIHLPRPDVRFCLWLFGQLTKSGNTDMDEDMELMLAWFRLNTPHPEWPGYCVVGADREVSYRVGTVMCLSGYPRCVRIGLAIVGQINHIARMN